MTSPRPAPSPLPAHPPRTKLPALICLGECQNPNEEEYGTRPASPDVLMIVDFSGHDPEEWDGVDPEEFGQALLDSQGGEEDLEEVAFHWMDAQGGSSDGSPDSLWIEAVLDHLTDQPDPFDLIAAEEDDEEDGFADPFDDGAADEDDRGDAPPDLEETLFTLMATGKADVEEQIVLLMIWNEHRLLELVDIAAAIMALYRAVCETTDDIPEASERAWNDTPRRKRSHRNPEPPYPKEHHRNGLIKSAACGRGRSKAVRDARAAARALRALELQEARNGDETAPE